MKKISAFRLFLLISIFCMPILPVAAEVLTGNCGETLYWSFDTETGHLEITGSGKTELHILGFACFSRRYHRNHRR